MELLLSASVSIRKLAFPGGALAWLVQSPGTPGDAPLVLVQHGLGSRKERHLELCLRLAEAGFLACTVDAAFHGERRTFGPDEAALSGDRSSPEFADAMARCVDRTADDLAEVAASLTDKPWALVGHSMGGFIALTAARRLPGLTRIVVIAGAIDTEAALDSPETRRRSPHRNVRELAGTDVLLLHGADDPVVLCEWSERLSRLAREQTPCDLTVYPGAGHDLTGEMIADAVNWLRKDRR